MRKLSVALVLGLVFALSTAVASAGDAPSPPSSPPGSLGGGRDGYRECSAYFSESKWQICAHNRIVVSDLNCSFSDREANCGGFARTGAFPWGTTGDGRSPYVAISWHPNGSGRIVTLTSYGHEQTRYPQAQLEGYVAGAGYKEFEVSKATAGNGEPFPAGDSFYTPNLPGRDAGAPGGPLYMKWSSIGVGVKSKVEIWGFLYLRGR